MHKKHHIAITFRGKMGGETEGIIFHTSLGKDSKRVSQNHTIY